MAINSRCVARTLLYKSVLWHFQMCFISNQHYVYSHWLLMLSMDPACIHGCFLICSFSSSFFTPRVHLFTYTHARELHTIYSLITHSINHFVATDDNSIHGGMVAEYGFIEDSVDIALKLHDFILTFHCNV